MNFKGLTLLFLLGVFSFHAGAETILYGYDNARQIRDVSYDSGAEVDYQYDTSGNRISKTVSTMANNSPSIPYKSSPMDSAGDVDVNAPLSWAASTDDDTGDTVSYDVYLGTTSPPALYKSGHDSTNFITFTLQPDKQYYWKIVARDNHNSSSEEGPLWSFTTEHIPVQPVAEPGGPYYEIEGQSMTLDASFSYDDSSITQYEWDINNDGTFEYSSLLPTQSHDYSQNGTYTIKLKVTDDEGETDEAITTAIISDSSPFVVFTADITSGEEPLTVNFDDASTAYDIPVERFWYFGDGTSRSYAPAGIIPHTFHKDGTFGVNLTVYDSDGSSESVTEVITVTDSSPTADFTSDVTYGNAPLTVSFANSSTGHDDPLNYDWDFGDGAPGSTEKDPVHIYADPGVYTVTLTVTDNDGSPDSLTRTNYITVCYPSANIAGDSAAFTSLQSAYDAAQDLDTIQCREETFTEDLTINRPISVSLEGGYNCLHTENYGMTTIEGNVTISDGTITSIENITIESVP